MPTLRKDKTYHLGEAKAHDEMASMHMADGNHMAAAAHSGAAQAHRQAASAHSVGLSSRHAFTAAAEKVTDSIPNKFN